VNVAEDDPSLSLAFESLAYGLVQGQVTLVRTVTPGLYDDQDKHSALNVHVDQARPGR
jgi:hypothetical protein